MFAQEFAGVSCLWCVSPSAWKCVTPLRTAGRSDLVENFIIKGKTLFLLVQAINIAEYKYMQNIKVFLCCFCSQVSFHLPGECLKGASLIR